MTVWKSVGISRYRGDVLGVEQFMEEAAARQVLALIAFIATLPGCRSLTVNEGRRTRARQRTLRARWEAFVRGGPWAPLAAVLYLSRHDEVNHGNAADLGGPNGEALNAAEIAAIKKYGPDFGVDFVGLTFDPPEPWHVEGDGVTPIPHYALASLDATPIDQEDDMYTDADRALAVEDRKALDQVKNDVAFIREAVQNGGSDSILTRLENAIGAIGIDTHATVEAVVYDDPALNEKRGHRSVAAMVREIFNFDFVGGKSMPDGQPATKLLERLLKRTGA